jgi:hypothetical protein
MGEKPCDLNSFSGKNYPSAPGRIFEMSIFYYL